LSLRNRLKIRKHLPLSFWLAFALILQNPVIILAENKENRGEERIVQTEIESSPDRRLVFNFDTVGRYNPDGIYSLLGVYYRQVFKINQELALDSSYLQGGISELVNPAYSQTSVHIEYMPAIFMKLRFQYDYYYYFGAFGGLLSFDSKDAEFGPDELEELEGEEEPTDGHRLLFRPTLRIKYGKVILNNMTDLAYFRYNGEGPYFREQQYDTLLEDGDYLVSSRIQLLYQVLDKPLLLAGSYYGVTHADAAGLTQQKLAGMVLWRQDTVFAFSSPRTWILSGIHLQDRNREDEFFAVAGFGFNYDF